MQGVPEHGANSTFAGGTCGSHDGGSHDGDYGGNLEGAGGPVDLESSRRKGRADGKPWQQDGDWPCPNPSCVNINFAFRGVCNRCGSARPSGNMASGGGGGRGWSRGANDSGGRGRGSGGPPGLFGPNDWNCPMCGNINWAKRLKCNLCNTSKPGYNEGGAREGRAGGFKEFDEAEIEETKRRRRENEEDDGEMYDEFGNLKKKFRTKAKPSAPSLAVPATDVGKAGWENDIGVVGGFTREKSKDRRNPDHHEDEKVSGGYTDLDSRHDRGYHHKDRGSKRTLRDY